MPTPTGLAAEAVGTRPRLEELAASPVGALGQALGIELVEVGIELGVPAVGVVVHPPILSSRSPFVVETGSGLGPAM